MIEDDPELERDVIRMCQTAEFRRLKRYIQAEDSQQGDADEVAKTIVTEIRKRLLDEE
jgi:hypothetical protein